MVLYSKVIVTGLPCRERLGTSMKWAFGCGFDRSRPLLYLRFKHHLHQLAICKNVIWALSVVYPVASFLRRSMLVVSVGVRQIVRNARDWTRKRGTIGGK